MTAFEASSLVSLPINSEIDPYFLRAFDYFIISLMRLSSTLAYEYSLLTSSPKSLIYLSICDFIIILAFLYAKLPSYLSLS